MMYQDANGLDNENFANFSFGQANDDQSLPIENILAQVPATDHRAATDLYNTITTLVHDISKFQEDLTVIHNLLFSFFTTSTDA